MRTCFLVSLTLLATSVAHAQVRVDPNLPSYSPAAGVSGRVKSVGSDTMANLMTYWSEGFHRYYPAVQVEIESKGSATAPAALIAGTAQFGPMSRPMKAKEIDDFEKKFGYKPTGLVTSLDVLAVYVHKDCPLQSMTFEQLDAIFSKNRKRGHERDITTWGDLGLAGAWAGKPISLYGRNEASGTYGYFKERVLANGDFKDTVKAMPGSAAVVQAVATDKFAMGYSGIGYKTADVHTVPLAARPSRNPVTATAEHALDGTYPLARPLLVYVNYKPGSQLDLLRAEFIKYLVSKEGQEVVIHDGYIPIPASLANRSLRSVGLGKDHPAR